MKRTGVLFMAFFTLLCVNNFGDTFNGTNRFDADELKKFAPRVFVDCWRCDRDLFRTEITYVNYVRDRQEADIHVLVTDQSTGSGGREYTFAFIGLNKFAALEHTLTYISDNTDTWDETRRGMTEVLKRGLFPFIMQTPIADFMSIKFQQKLKPTAVKDKWNFWVFNIGLDGRISGETSRSSSSVDMDFSAVRITPDLKIRLGLSGEFDERKYEYDDETIVSKSEEKDFRGLVVKSLGSHWSAGSWFEASANTYSNLDSFFSIAPAVEYNFFPYSESTRRQLRVLYKLGIHKANYNEETIYDKTSETLLNESLAATLSIREPWGSASTTLEGSHYFHDLKKYRFQLRGSLSFRVFRGLNLSVRGSYERIHDQLGLPKGDATIDEVLLQRKELATDFDYSISVGLSYTFGSVFSNVVNPRFEGSRRRFF